MEGALPVDSLLRAPSFRCQRKTSLLCSAFPMPGLGGPSVTGSFPHLCFACFPYLFACLAPVPRSQHPALSPMPRSGVVHAEASPGEHSKRSASPGHSPSRLQVHLAGSRGTWKQVAVTRLLRVLRRQLTLGRRGALWRWGL